MNIPIIPTCKYNSYFNGFTCVCKEGFFEYSKGVCATCPSYMFWNGQKCSYNSDCWRGYVWSVEKRCCIPEEAANCPANSQWNGAYCACNAGYNKINDECVKCPAGFQFNGVKCVYVQTPVVCNGTEQIVVADRCVCRDGFNEYKGNCIACPFPSVWNGAYCDLFEQNCNAITHASVIGGICRCKEGYSMKEDLKKCVKKGTPTPYSQFSNTVAPPQTNFGTSSNNFSFNP